MPTPKGQQEIARYQPGMIGVEWLPEKQAEMDSLYALYCQNKLDRVTLPGAE